MADANDDLLEDGDMSEANFELDLAEEDALLADDDDKPVIGGSRINDIEASQDDDDYLELGVDEDLSFNDDEIIENGSRTKKHTPIAIAFNDDDSDDNAKCGSERERFKSERQIIARSSTAIPETLDAVTVRQPMRTSRGGGVRGKLVRGAGGVGGGMMRGGVRPPFRGGGNFRFHPPPQGISIHVNPHFRPRHPPPPPGGAQLWNGGYHGHPPHPHPHPPYHPQPPYSGFQPPIQNQQWQDPNYYHPPQGPPMYGQQPPDNNYYGGPPQDQYYPPQQSFGPQHPPPHAQMGGFGWGDTGMNFTGPAPHNQNFTGPPNLGPYPPGPPQMMAPRMRPPCPPRGPHPFVRPPQQFQQQKPFQQQQKPLFQGGKQWNRGGKREHPGGHLVEVVTNKVPPVKQQRTEAPSSVYRVLSNLEEVRTVDKIPAAVAQQQHAPPEEEDEEMKAYRKKIEEQKKLREKILQQKEQKRMVAAQQKEQKRMVAAQQKQQVITTLPLSNNPPATQQPPAKTEPFKMVRIKTSDGKTIIKKMSVATIQKLKKSAPMGLLPPSLTSNNSVESRVVSVDNLSASTTHRQLVNMASQLGPLEKVELDAERKRAIIKFQRNDSARLFLQKYQRKMVDLSMIGVKLVRQE